MPSRAAARGPKGRVQRRKQSGVDKLFSFISQLTLLAVWKTVATVSAPFGRVIAFYLWWGKTFFRLTSFVQRIVYKTIGWLSGPAVPRAHWLRQWGRDYFPLDIKRWHVTVGGRPPDRPRLATGRGRLLTQIHAPRSDRGGLHAALDAPAQMAGAL
jgi:hypothetical protein